MRLVTALVSVESRHLYMSQVLQVDPEDPEHLEMAQGFPSAREPACGPGECGKCFLKRGECV